MDKLDKVLLELQKINESFTRLVVSAEAAYNLAREYRFKQGGYSGNKLQSGYEIECKTGNNKFLINTKTGQVLLEPDLYCHICNSNPCKCAKENKCCGVCNNNECICIGSNGQTTKSEK